MTTRFSDLRPILLVGVLFLISYLIVWIIGSLWLNRWDSPMHWLVPIPAFFLSYWLFSWVEREFHFSQSSLGWPVLILVMGFVSFFVAQVVYWCNGVTDIATTDSTCSSEGLVQAIGLVSGQLGELLFRDAFFYFWIMVLLAWVCRFVFLSAIPSSKRSSSKQRAS